MGLVIFAALVAVLKLFWSRITGQPVPAPGTRFGHGRGKPGKRAKGHTSPAAPNPTAAGRHDAAAPAATAGANSHDIDCEVLVVGAGPTGLMAANLLKRSGVKVRIVESRLSPSTESRAFAVQARTVELFQSIGLAGALLNRSIINTGIDFHVAGKRLGGLDFDRAQAPDTPFQFLTMIPQADSEALLIADLEQLGVTIERGVSVQSLVQTDRQVTTTCTGIDGRTTSIRSRYIIGADGAHSVVRKQLGLSFEGSKYAQSFLLADCRVDWNLDHGRFRVFMNGDRIGLFLPLRGRAISRVMATDPRGGVDAEGQPITTLDLAELQTAFSEAAKVPVQLVGPVWTARYRVHHRGVDRYRSGRAFVAGDAAHIHSPAGGQGMNTGLQDAANLSWKLAAVLRQGAPDALLDTYHDERFPVGQDVLRFTDRLFSAAAAQTGWRAWMRDRLASFIVPKASRLPIPHRKAFRKLSEIAISYPMGGFVKEGYEVPLRGPSAGERAPDARISHDQTMFELLGGYRMTLLVISREPLNEREILELDMQRKALVARTPGLNAHIVARVAGRRDPRITFVDHNEVFARYGMNAKLPQAVYLVRPDGYVAWCSAGLSLEECADFLGRLMPTVTASAVVAAPVALAGTAADIGAHPAASTAADTIAGASTGPAPAPEPAQTLN